jgi:putative ABC transport system permease protein
VRGSPGATARAVGSARRRAVLLRLGRETIEATRLLARRPGAALLAVVTMGVGMAALVVVLGIANALFLAPLPGVLEPGRLVRVTTPTGPGSVPNLRDLAERAAGVDGMSVFVDQLVTLGVDEGSEQLLAVFADASYFPVLGVRPALGRTWTAAEAASAAPVVVVGDELWRRRFAADPAVVGRRVTVQGEPFTVVGIAPPGFQGTFRGFGLDLWLPLETGPRLVDGIDLEDRSADRAEVVARLATGVAHSTAAAELAALGETLATEHPAVNASLAVDTAPLTGLDDEIRGPALALVAVLLALAAVVLGLTVANVAGVLLARLLARRGELAVRAALGATTRGLGRLLLWEALLLAAAAAGLGMVLAMGAGRLLVRSLDELPIRLALDLSPGPRVVGLVAAVVVLVAGVLVAPAVLAISRGGLLAALRTTGGGHAAGGRGGLRAMLVVGQVAAATALLLAGAALWRGLQTAQTAEDPRLAGVFVAPFLDLRSLRLEPEAVPAARAALLAAAAASPGVLDVAVASRPPLPGGVPDELFAAESPREPGRRGTPAHVALVGASYFSTLGIALRQGNVWHEPLAQAEAPAVLDATLAAELFSAGPAVGRRLRLGNAADAPVVTVIGVAEALSGPSGEPRPTLYRPFEPTSTGRFALLVRAREGAAETLAGDVRSGVQAALPGVPPVSLERLTTLREVGLLPQRLAAGAGGLLGGLGLLVAAAGLYGLLSLLLAQAARELALRAAMGASPLALVRGVAARAAGLAVIGFGLGAAMAAVASGPLGSLLGGGLDPVAVGAVAAAVLLATVAAAAQPAWRASRVDPARTLRGA